MSTALRKLEHATFATFTVEAGQTVTLNRLVQLSAAGVRLATAGSDTVIGIARTTQAATERVDVTLYSHIEAVDVGTNGSTAGVKQQGVATGVEDAAAHDSSGGTDDAIVGVAMQTGVVGDVIGMMMLLNNRGSA